jgi:hypothetical protein
MTISESKLITFRRLVSRAALALHDRSPNRVKKRAETISESAADASAAGLSQMAAELLQIVQDRRDEMIEGIVSSTGADRRQAERALDATSAGRTLDEIVGAMQAVLKALEGAGDALGKRTSDRSGVAKAVTQEMLDALHRTVAVQPTSDQREQLLGVIADADPQETSDRQYEQMIAAARSLPQEVSEMTQKHEFAKNGQLPDTYYDQFGNVRPEMTGAALDHLAKAHSSQAYERTESEAERLFYQKVEELTEAGSDFSGACAQVAAAEPELAKRAFDH